MISIIVLLLSVAFGLGKGTKMVRRNEKLRTMNRALLRTLRELQVGAGEGDYTHISAVECYVNSGGCYNEGSISSCKSRCDNDPQCLMFEMDITSESQTPSQCCLEYCYDESSCSAWRDDGIHCNGKGAMDWSSWVKPTAEISEKKDPEYCHDEYASCYNKYYEERCPVKCGGSSNAVDKTEINEDIQGCVPCKCNTHDPTADPAYTDCGATDDSAFWRYGPSYINCYEPSNRQGKYEFKLFGSCPEKAEPQDSCMCVTSWTSPGECDVTQHGCPAFACEDPAEPRWCIVADDGCIGGNLGGYMECDDDTPVFGESEVGGRWWAYDH